MNTLLFKIIFDLWCWFRRILEKHLHLKGKGPIVKQPFQKLNQEGNPSEQDRQHWQIQIEDRTWILPSGNYLLGASQEADICFNHSMLSSQHAYIRLNPKQSWIVDLGSTNGIFINGNKLQGRCFIPKQICIDIGPVELRINQKST